MSGLTADGFVIETQDEIRESMNEDMRTAFGPSIDLSDGSIQGQVIAIVSERLALLWELAEAVNASQDPDEATGANLEALAALTGTLREAARASTATLTLTGDDTTVVSEGSQAATSDTGAVFATDAEATLAALDAWANTTAYAVGDRVTNASRAYVCTDAGTSAGSGGPTTTSSAITDGGCIWRYMGEGAAAVDVAATCTETGATVATSGAITEIETPVSGWDGVINLEDADVGAAQMSDENLRVQREIDLAAPGTSPIPAIRSELLDVEGVTAVTVFYNNTDLTDVDGVPPHAIEALVQGGEDQDIWDQLFASVAGGIATHGDESGTVEDSQGTEHTLKFSRPEELEIYVDVNVTVDPDEFPADGEDQIKAAIVAWGAAQRAGKDVVASAISAQVFGVTGVLDVTDIDIGTSPAPGAGTTVAVSLRQLADYDTSRITVTVAEGTP